MNFKSYLIEKFESSRHMITYQKLLMALDTAHISKEDSMYEFNLGAVVKDSSLKGLHVRIQKGDDLSVRLGKHKDGRYIIVISVKKLPERMKIDTMFSTNESLMKKFVGCVEDYYNNYREQSDVEPTKAERSAGLLDAKNVEESYDKLVAALDSKLAEYKAALRELEKKEKYTVNMFTKASIEQAKKALKDDYFGNSDSEFVKKVRKMPEADFISYLEKDVQKKIEKRLENYYDQKI